MSRRTRVFTDCRTRTHALLEDHPKLKAAAVDLDYCASDNRLALALARLWDARAALPGAANYDSSGGHSDSGSSTERHAVTGDRTQRDRDTFDASLRTLDGALGALERSHLRQARNLAAACRAAYTIRRTVDAWTARQATAKDQKHSEHTAGMADECTLTRQHLGLHVRAHRTTDLHGMLPTQQPVGRWAYDFASRRGRLPSQLEWDRHAIEDDDLRTQRIRRVTAGR